LSWIENEFKGRFNEKDRSYSWPVGEIITAASLGIGQESLGGVHRDFRGGKREVRQLPFDKTTFREICKKFYVHPSISRVISRADVPVFSRADIKMDLGNLDGREYSAIGNNTYFSIFL
jgi:hypothetical protein